MYSQQTLDRTPGEITICMRVKWNEFIIAHSAEENAADCTELSRLRLQTAGAYEQQALFSSLFVGWFYLVSGTEN